ncbi:MAG TPA: hypothetical protein VFK52_10760 [Nocardioidaceae bacterium]|nr:hypothetical protein [Nocardioidaceae bacterium]
MTWELRAVDQNGTLVSTIKTAAGGGTGVNIRSIQREINARKRLELECGTLLPDATFLDLFENELQVWRDGSLFDWFRPARHDADVSDSADTLRVTCEGLFGYFHDVVVGGQRVNRIVSPHLDAAAEGAAPASWTKTGSVEAAAIVTNNAEFWQTPKAIQLNNSEAAEDAYIYQRYTVPSGLDRVPFAASATVYVAEGDGTGSNPPAYGGAALKERGLMIIRLNAAGTQVMSKSKVARITDETPRNQVVRLQTPEVLPYAGEIIEVRCYAPKAWTVWRHVALLDGMAVVADRVDKSVAFQRLVTHAQDTTLGKQNRNITTNVVSIGETISRQWPWWRRDNIGEQLEQLADTFEFDMAYSGQVVDAGWDQGAWDAGVWDGGTTIADQRTVLVRERIGLDRSATVSLTKTDLLRWGLGSEIGTSASRVIVQGEGSGIARDEVWVDDGAALNGHVVERLEFAGPGASLAALNDFAAEMLARLKKLTELPRLTVGGELAVTVNPGDTVELLLNHGAAQVPLGDFRVLATDLVPDAMTATWSLEAVS